MDWKVGFQLTEIVRIFQTLARKNSDATPGIETELDFFCQVVFCYKIVN